MCAKRKSAEPWHDDARQAVKVLREGGLLLHATDTVWGLACDATNDDAVQRLNQLKSRHPEHPVLVLVADEGHVEELVTEVPDAAWDLMDHADRPTTIVYPSGKGVSPLLKGSNGSLAIPMHPRRVLRLRHPRFGSTHCFHKRQPHRRPHTEGIPRRA